jgi:anaerobic magnesium-protoporphyrin IX monomethyl ester cyclase
MKIALINPSYTPWKDETQFMKKVLGSMAPLGLLSLASYALKHVEGIDVKIIDSAALSYDISTVVEKLKEYQPDLIGVTMTTTAVKTVEMLSTAIKQEMPRVKIVVGGPHVSALKKEVLKQLPAADFAIAGEGEQTFAELIQALINGDCLSAIDGLSYRDTGSGIVQNSPRCNIASLDDIPDPAWHLLDGFPKNYKSNVFCSPSGLAASISTSRGCPYGCTFCDQSTFGNKPRMLSATHIFKMVKHLHDKYKIRYISFCDDLFTVNRARVLEFCELMADWEGSVKWSCDANILTVDDELLKSMKKANCWCISFGLESGSDQVLKSMNKNSDIKTAENAVRMTNDNGIHAKGLFILGTPLESEETIEETKKFILSLPLSTINVSKFTPYLGTELYLQVKDQMPEEKFYDNFNGMSFIVPSKHLSVEQLEQGYGDIISAFYHSRRARMFHFPMMISDFGKIWRLLSVIIPGVKYRFGKSNTSSPEK